MRRRVSLLGSSLLTVAVVASTWGVGAVTTADAFAISYVPITLQLGGQQVVHLTDLRAINPWNHKPTSWMTVGELVRTLPRMDMKVGWNTASRQLTIETPAHMAKNGSYLPAAEVMKKDTMAIILNGKVVAYAPYIAGPDPVTGAPTPYVSVYSVNQVFNRLGATVTWQGGVWKDGNWQSGLWNVHSNQLHIVAHPAALMDIHMVNQLSGWGLSGHHIWRTVNGGVSWVNVTPTLGSTQFLAEYGYFGQSSNFFLSTTDAWIVEQPTNSQVSSPNRLVLAHTANGGAAWSTTSLPVAAAAASGSVLSFANPQDGWLMVPMGAAAGSEGVSVWRTTDGGQSWHIVSQGDLNHSAIPFVGDKSGIGFVSASTGWIAGTDAASDYTWLYRTTDAGVSWVHQALVIPPSQKTAELSVSAPEFFSSTSGILPVMGNGLTVYRTQNGGVSWSPAKTLSIRNVPPTNIDFVNANTGWVLTKSMTQTGNISGAALHYLGANGSWSVISTEAFLKYANQIDFVTPQIGWAIASPPTSATFHGGTVLAKTVNGGKTWTVMRPTGLLSQSPQ
ncbi:MAG: WD40/YVTN/BNR-like repeat-containing protein [Bacilli bacterium]